MKQKLWKCLYAGAGVLCLVSGTISLSPSKTAGTNADWFLVALALLAGFALPIGSVWFAKMNGVNVFPQASLDRHPFRWWSDPLQSIRVTLLAHVSWLSGALFSLPQADHRGVMIFWTLAALTGGLYSGERVALRQLQTAVR